VSTSGILQNVYNISIFKAPNHRQPATVLEKRMFILRLCQFIRLCTSVVEKCKQQRRVIGWRRAATAGEEKLNIIIFSFNKEHTLVFFDD